MINIPIIAFIRVVLPFLTLSSSQPAVNIWNPPYIAKITAIIDKKPNK